jgi:hypothetical protein
VLHRVRTLSFSVSVVILLRQLCRRSAHIHSLVLIFCHHNQAVTTIMTDTDDPFVLDLLPPSPSRPRPLTFFFVFSTSAGNGEKKETKTDEHCPSTTLHTYTRQSVPERVIGISPSKPTARSSLPHSPCHTSLKLQLSSFRSPEHSLLWFEIAHRADLFFCLVLIPLSLPSY